MPGPDSEWPDAGDAEQAYGLARLLALGDGLFAFALTLLVVQLTVPTLARGDVGQLVPACSTRRPVISVTC